MIHPPAYLMKKVEIERICGGQEKALCAFKFCGLFRVIIIIMANKSGDTVLKLLKVQLQQTVDEAIAFGFKLVVLGMA